MEMETAVVQVKSEAEEGSEAEADAEGASRRGVGRLVDCSQADDRRMIGLVRDRPLLYARTNMPVASYQAHVKKLWREVADIMQWTVAEVRRKWSHVRNSYSRHLRNEIHGVRTGKGRMVSKWYLADELEFLREHMATDTRASPYSLVASFPPTFLKAELDGAGGWRCSPPPAPASPGEPEDEDAAYFQFFRGIHTDYRRLCARSQRRFRRQCLVYLHALVDADPDTPHSPPPPPPPDPDSYTH